MTGPVGFSEGVTYLSRLPADHPRRVYVEYKLRANIRSHSECAWTAWYALGQSWGLDTGWRGIPPPAEVWRRVRVDQVPAFFSGYFRGRSLAAALRRDLLDHWQAFDHWQGVAGATPHSVLAQAEAIWLGDPPS